MNVNGTTGYTGYAANEVNRSSAVNYASKVKSYDPYVRDRDNFFNRKEIDNVTGLGQSASDLYNAADKLNNASLYNSYYAKSSNSSYVDVDSSGNPTAQKNYTVEVDKLATGQTNEGARLSEDGVFAGAAGRHNFEIDMNGRKHTLSVDVKAGDTNEQVLRKMANAVNGADIGINAWVSNSNRRNTSQLVFQSEGVGDLAKNKFSVRDSSGSSLVADTGIANTAQAAQDAVYTVNNRDYTSHDNEVSLGNGINVTLKKETRNPIEISVNKDTSDMVDTAYKFVDAYNKLLSDSKSKTNGDTRLNRSLNVYSSSYSGGFKRSGILRGSDGSLSIDRKALLQAAENGSLERLFEDTRASYGPANRIMYIARNVQRNPSSYIDNRKSNPGYAIYSASSSRNGSNHGFMFSFGTIQTPYAAYGNGNYSLFNLYS